jgi:NAD+ kinase
MRVRRVAILGHTGRPGIRRAALRLIATLKRRRIECRVDARLGAELGLDGQPLRPLARWAQVLVTLGGDGTTLAGARALAGTTGVLLPINLGGLGFLTIADGREVLTALDHALSGGWPVVRRRLLSAIVRRRGRTVARGVAMNDVVVKGGGGHSAVHLRMGALGDDLGHLVADGIIAATASGSTAYSLSAGGPVVAPDVEAMVVTPVCGHALATRTLVLGPGTELDLRVIGSFDRVVLLFDGMESADLAAGDTVRVRLDRTAVRMFRNPARPFLRSLQRKLGWQGSPRRSF